MCRPLYDENDPELLLGKEDCGDPACPSMFPYNRDTEHTSGPVVRWTDPDYVHQAQHQ